MKEKVIVIFSGGMDSATLLSEVCSNEDYEVEALGFNYGQRHNVELVYATRFAAMLGLIYRVVDLGTLKYFLGSSSQTNDAIAVPEGHYAEESMKLTVVPNRNMIMLAVATGVAIAEGASRVFYAAHAGDHAIYPDCRPEFVEALKKAIGLCDWKQVELSAPYLALSKADIVKRGSTFGVDYAATWSCYKGRDKHCGKCGTCTERREAFELAGVTDPTVYE